MIKCLALDAAYTGETQNRAVARLTAAIKTGVVMSQRGSNSVFKNCLCFVVVVVLPTGHF